MMRRSFWPIDHLCTLLLSGDNEETISNAIKMNRTNNIQRRDEYNEHIVSSFEYSERNINTIEIMNNNHFDQDN